MEPDPAWQWPPPARILPPRSRLPRWYFTRGTVPGSMPIGPLESFCFEVDDDGPKLMAQWAADDCPRLTREPPHRLAVGKVLPFPECMTSATGISLERTLTIEIKLMIFAHLRDIDRSSLAAARLISWHFYDIVTPLLYTTLNVTPRLLSSPVPRHPFIRRHLAQYTRNLVFTSNVDIDAAREFLTLIPTLQTIRWIYLTNTDYSNGLPNLRRLISSADERFKCTKIYLQDLRIRHYTDNLEGEYLRTIPLDLVTSIECAMPQPPFPVCLDSLKELLLEARNLKSLFIHDVLARRGGLPKHFVFNPGERFPPLRELSLRYYHWVHETAENWDFSQLQRLTVLLLPLSSFLGSIDLAQLSNLNYLHMEDLLDLKEDQPMRKLKATSLVYSLVRDHIKELKTLRATIALGCFAVDALVAHGNTLERLHLRDYPILGDDNDNAAVSTFTTSELEVLARALTELHTLELDVTEEQLQEGGFLRTLLQFPKLEHVKLHIHVSLTKFDTRSLPMAYCDIDYGVGVSRMLIEAVAERRRTDMEMMGFPTTAPAPTMPWRSFAVDVALAQRLIARLKIPSILHEMSNEAFEERTCTLERPVLGPLRLTDEIIKDHRLTSEFGMNS